MPGVATTIGQISTIAIPVADQARAVAFYVDVLGLEKTRDVPFGEGQRWIEVTPRDGGTTLALPPQGFVRPGVDTGIRFTSDDAAADHAALQASAVDVDTEVLRYPGVPPMFSFRDPDGNTLYVVERM